MRIVDLLKKDSILLGGTPKSKSEAIDMLVDLQATLLFITMKEVQTAVHLHRAVTKVLAESCISI